MSGKISIMLDEHQSLVLFEMLSRWSEIDDLSRVIDHPSEDDVLASILAGLEQQLAAPFESGYSDRLTAARNRVALSGG